MPSPDAAELSSVAAPPQQINALKALNSQRRFSEMLERGTALAKQYPGDHVVHFLLASAYVRIGKPDEAIASYTMALAIKPGFTLAHSGLCALYDKLNRIDDLANALDRAGQNGLRDDPQMLVLSAMLASRRRNFEETLATLNNVRVEELPLRIQKEFHVLLGKTYDRLGRFDEAFAQFDRQNQLAKGDLYRHRIDPMNSFNGTVQLAELWAGEPVTDLAVVGEVSNEMSLAFLVGFPRSGTTLLDTILRSHPAVVVVEEKPMVDKMRDHLRQTASIEELNRLTVSATSSEAARLREIYLDELRRHIAESDMDKLIVDKFPLNMRYAGLMHRVFPEAKFILALRHPCDSVLSCFMQNFNLNAAMANFLSLEQAARYYVAVMDLWRVYRNRLNLDVHSVKYEDLVRDLRGTCMPLVEFLGLEWDDNLLNYRETAQKRDFIRTPSYDQVVQPLYDQASGRWQNYRKQMTPVLPLLEPWIREFGYSASCELSGDKRLPDRE